jgi:hypothetical protein
MINQPQLKVCSRCKVGKDESEFHKQSRHCKACKSEFDRAYFRKVSKQRTAYKQKRREENQRRLYEYLTGKRCEWPEGCEITDPDMLTFDHLDRETKRAGVPQLMGYSWKSILAEIKKCRILCANHHFKWTVQQMGYKRFLENKNSQVT